MPASAPIPHALDEVVAETASILAQGYLRRRKNQLIPAQSSDEDKKVRYSHEFTENRLDSSGP